MGDWGGLRDRLDSLVTSSMYWPLPGIKNHNIVTTLGGAVVMLVMCCIYYVLVKRFIHALFHSPAFSKTIWSSCDSFMKPGTIFANSIICWMTVVNFWAHSSQSSSCACQHGHRVQYTLTTALVQHVPRIKL